MAPVASAVHLGHPDLPPDKKATDLLVGGGVNVWLVKA